MTFPLILSLSLFLWGFYFGGEEGYIASGEPGAHKWAASREVLNCPTGPVHAY